MFAGDTLRSRADSYAAVRFSSGQTVELGSNTQVTVGADQSDESVVQLALASGHMAFASDVASPLSIAIAPLEFYLDADASGDVAIVGDKTVGVRVREGSVLVRNMETKTSFVLTKGQEKLIGRYNGIVADPIAVIASAMPTPIPSSAPAAPQQGSGLSSGSWAAIIALVAGGSAVGAFFAGGSGKVDEGDLNTANSTISTQGTQITSLNSQINDLNASIAPLSASIAVKNAEIAALDQDVTSLDGQLSNARITAGLELTALQNRLASIQAQLVAGQAKAAVLASSLSEAEQAALTEAADVLIEDIGEIGAEILAVEEDLGDLADFLALVEGVATGEISGLTSGISTGPGPTVREAVSADLLALFELWQVNPGAAEQQLRDSSPAELQSIAENVIISINDTQGDLDDATEALDLQLAALASLVNEVIELVPEFEDVAVIPQITVIEGGDLVVASASIPS